MSQQELAAERSRRHIVLIGLLSCALLLPLLARPVAAAGPYDWQVQQMYIAYYGRPGDPAGVDYWARRLAAAGGNWIGDLVNAFGSSAEYTERFGSLDHATLIDNLYQQLFNRMAEPIGLSFYVDLLNGTDISGYNPGLRQSTLAAIALDVANGAANDDALMLQNKLAVAQHFTAVIAETATPSQSDHINEAVRIIANVTYDNATVTCAKGATDAFVGIETHGELRIAQKGRSRLVNLRRSLASVGLQ